MKPPNIKAPKCTLFSSHKGSPVLPRLLPSIVMGSLLRSAHFESLRAAEAKNAATINQLKYPSRSCITENMALRAWSRALGCASCFIGSRPRHGAIFPLMHSHGTLTSIYTPAGPWFHIIITRRSLSIVGERELRPHSDSHACTALHSE